MNSYAMSLQIILQLNLLVSLTLSAPLHSRCKDSSSTGRGRIYHSRPGYEGKPYLLGGCQGSFECYCSGGLTSDGRKDGTACPPNDQASWFTSIYYPLGVFVLAPALASTWILWTHQNNKLVKHKRDMFKQNGGNLLLKKLSELKNPANKQIKVYTTNDIKKATKDYSNRVEYKCRPGTFYIGKLADSENIETEVLITKISRLPGSQIEHFVNQLIFLSQPHKTLVKIIGCCLETIDPLLVYELHGDGTTLFDHLYNEDLMSRFSSKKRVKVAAGVAKALVCLHSQNSRPIVHGNIRSSSILLDDYNDAKLFYGVASNLIAQDSHSSEQENHVYSSGQLNPNSDVYNFGVVLTELQTGLKAFAADRHRIDRNLDADDAVKEYIATLAGRCLSENSVERPSMKEVEAKLSALMQLK